MSVTLAASFTLNPHRATDQDTVLTATVEVPTKVVFSSVSVEMTSFAVFNSFSLHLSQKASGNSTWMAGKRLVKKKKAFASATNGNTTGGKRV